MTSDASVTCLETLLKQSMQGESTHPTKYDNKHGFFIVLLEQCKQQQIKCDKQPFLREVTGAPELRCVLAFDWQLHDLTTFSTNLHGISLVRADPTFNL